MACADCRLARKSATLKQHRLDLLPKLARRPALKPAEFDVEVAFERIVNVDQILQKHPAQFSPHCGENCFVGKDFGRPKAVTKLLLAPSTSVPGGQCSGQRCNQLLPAIASFPARPFRAGVVKGRPSPNSADTKMAAIFCQKCN
jgi:hypothetical protein